MPTPRSRSNLELFAVVLSASAALAVATPAAAVPLQFTFSGDLNGSFIVDSNPTPTSTTATSFFTNMWGVTGDFAGESANEFFVLGDGGGFFTDPNGDVEAFGPQLFTGTLANPVFAPGKFVVTDFTATLFADVNIATAPGAPGPELAGGLLASLAALATLAFTRLRRRAVPA